MMINRLNVLLSGCTLVLFLTLVSCGKEDTPEESSEPAETAIGNIIEAAQKTADKANAQTKEIEKAAR